MTKCLTTPQIHMLKPCVPCDVSGGEPFGRRLGVMTVGLSQVGSCPRWGHRRACFLSAPPVRTPPSPPRGLHADTLLSVTTVAAARQPPPAVLC